MNCKKLSLIIILSMLLSVLWVGCTEDPAQSDPTASDTTQNSVPTTEAPTDPTEATERVKEFPLEIAPTVAVPTPDAALNVTPREFAEVLLVENKAPFTGPFMECEPSDIVRVYDVYALGLTNIGEKTIESITLVYNNGEKDLTFYAEMIPAGWTVVVMDTECTQATSTDLIYVSCDLQYLEAGREVTNEVQLTETAYGTVIVKNMSEETMPTVTVYYRDTDYMGNVLAGRCFRATTTMEMIPGWQEELETEQWLPSCRIVNVVVEDAPIDGNE